MLAGTVAGIIRFGPFAVMIDRSGLVVAALLAFLVIWGATRNAAAEEFPVWWSPKLEVESLDKLDERLSRKFPVGGQLEATVPNS